MGWLRDQDVGPVFDDQGQHRRLLCQFVIMVLRYWRCPTDIGSLAARPMPLSSSTPSQIKYPNQPLVEVSCEIRFFGEPVVEARRHEFFEQIRGKYPLLLVPRTKDGSHIALQHYRFEAEDHNSMVMLAVNSIVYSQREYVGSVGFINEFLRIFKICDSLFKIRDFSRAGWRYINVINFTRENGRIPLSRFFNGPPNIFSITSNEYERVSFAASTKCEEETLALRLESDSPEGGTERILFDIDVFRDNLKESKFHAEDAPKLIDRLHCVARNFFEGSITDKYRDYLKGDAI